MARQIGTILIRMKAAYQAMVCCVKGAVVPQSFTPTGGLIQIAAHLSIAVLAPRLLPDRQLRLEQLMACHIGSDLEEQQALFALSADYVLQGGDILLTVGRRRTR